MIKLFKGLCIAILFGFGMAACDSFEDKPLKRDFDRTEQELRIEVFLYDNQSELNKAHKERFGGKEIGLLGFAVWANPGKKPYWCEIHAVEPKRADDNNMDTLGHELAHCIFGQFHPKP